jgi:hypothetical protein
MKRLLTMGLILVAGLYLTGCAGTGGRPSISERSEQTGAAISSYATKTTPVSADKFLISDSEASWATKNVTFNSLVTTGNSGYALYLGALSDLQILDTGTTYTNLVDDTVAYGGTYDAKHVWSIDKVGSVLATKLESGGNIGAGTATTPSANDNDTSIATTAYVQSELSAYASDTVTLTNKTLDTAGTGNAITVPLNGVLDGAITDPADADDMIYVKAPNAMTITDIHCNAEGGGSITLTLQECNDATCSSPSTIENAITCNGGNDEDDGTLTDGSIAAGAWIKVLFSAPTGTVSNLAWSVYGTQTW